MLSRFKAAQKVSDCCQPAGLWNDQENKHLGIYLGEVEILTLGRCSPIQWTRVWDYTKKNEKER